MSQPSSQNSKRLPQGVKSALNEKIFFDAFGFLVCRNALKEGDIVLMRSEAESIFFEDWGEIYDGKERQQIQGFVERSKLLVDYIKNEQILARVRRLIGRKLVWIGSDGNRYVGATGWHPDGSNMNVRRIKVLFYLDHQLRDSGALRVFPGSHRPELHQNLRILLQRPNKTITPYGVLASKRKSTKASGFGIPADLLPSYPIETRPGDIVFFDQNIWHSSFGGDPGRMMFTMNFAEHPRLEEDWKFVLRMYRGQLNHIRRYQKSRRQFLYGENLANHTDLELVKIIKPMLDRGCL